MAILCRFNNLKVFLVWGLFLNQVMSLNQFSVKSKTERKWSKREENYGITRAQDLAISQNGKYEYGYDFINRQILSSRDEHRDTNNNKW